MTDPATTRHAAGPAKFIVRLDDACPTMRRASWDRIEEAATALHIRPIVGVIPDCRDPSMLIDPPEPGFWERMRRWQSKGWHIALHGLNHLYHDDPKGSRALVPFHRHGEFVGLPLDAQRALLRQALVIFSANGVAPTFFMAPSHSFDSVTLEALAVETPIRWITDGVSFRPFSRHGFLWLPQQTWGFRAVVPLGVWTVCLHPNTMRNEEVDDLVQALKSRRAEITSADAVAAPLAYGAADAAFAALYWTRWRIKAALGR